METAAWARVGASAMVRARSNSSNATWHTVSGLPIFYVVPHMYWAPLCTVSLPCVCTVTRSCYSACVVYRTTICARHYAAVVRRVAFCIMECTSSKYYLPLFCAGAVVYPPRYPPPPISILELLAVVADTV